MKTLCCSKCGREVGRIIKGRIKKDAAVLCGECKHILMTLQNNMPEMPDIFKTIFDQKDGK